MNHNVRVYDNVFEMLPSEENPTPMVRINRLNKAPDFQLYAKLEWMCPFGSVKDRAAWEMLRDLEERGEIGGQRGIVEPTSGNTGISLAAMARARGVRLAIVPGDRREDVRLDAASTLDVAALRTIWRYFEEGGPDNLLACLRYVAGVLHRNLNAAVGFIDR